MKGLLALFFSFFSLTLTASNSVTGVFEATSSCPAYVSKNKKTNPDNVYTENGRHYDLVEINKINNPDWLRINIGDGNQSLRWVSASCGKATYDSKPSGGCQQDPGLADSHVLALSWQPAFCQTYGYEAGKPECLKLPAKSWQASHLVMHGLWPNQNACGQNYGFCSTRPQAHHCDYPPVSLNPTVAQELSTLMPSYAYGSCLERHEWTKHGSCQILSSNDYFALALRLTREAAESPFGAFLHEHSGQQVTRPEIQAAIRETFGKDSIRKIYLGCKNGLLVDVYIQLPALIPGDETLRDLVAKAPELNRYDGCPAKFGISDFNSEQWY